MADKTLRPGDTLTIPEGWTVEFRGNEVHLSHANYTSISYKGFAVGDFFKQAAVDSEGKDNG